MSKKFLESMARTFSDLHYHAVLRDIANDRLAAVVFGTRDNVRALDKERDTVRAKYAAVVTALDRSEVV